MTTVTMTIGMIVVSMVVAIYHIYSTTSHSTIVTYDL
jgi:hypothetical protein